MKTVDHIIKAKWLIPCEGPTDVLSEQSLIVHEGRIQDILPQAEAKGKYHSASVHEYTKHAVLPGFINAHTHIAMNYFRGLADDLAVMDWLTQHIWPAEARCLSPQFVYDGSLFAIAEMIRSGTTCFNDMFFFMPDVARATEKAKVRGNIGLHFITFKTPWAQDVNDEFEKAMAFYDEFKNSPYVHLTTAVHSLYTVTKDEDLIRIKELATRLKLKMNMHVQEGVNEIDIIYKQAKMRPLERLKALGLLDQDLIAVHMLHINEQDFELLAAHKPQVAHCPESNMKLSSGTCPVHELLSRGVNVALGTDGAASNNDLSMLGEMRTASFLSKHITKNPETLPAKQVLQMATINGAKALGIDHLTGSLVKGKEADFIAIRLDELESLPVYNPISQIVYATSREQVTDVWVKGTPLMQNRKLTTLDEIELAAKAREWGEKIRTI